MQWRGATTNQLGDVIQTIQLVHRSGVLKVEKNEEGVIQEEGTITFISGQITEAHLGILSGPAAFNRIVSWKSCRFTFLAAETQASGPLLPPGSSDQYITSNDMSPGNFSPHDTGPNALISKDTGPYMRLPRDTGATTGRLPNLSSGPYRLRDVNEVIPHFASMGLSRLHRHLFLLIDGQRTMSELVHILGRQPAEVYMLLADLERAGLIKQ
jgi:Domain of unknown function (DUF4388)